MNASLPPSLAGFHLHSQQQQQMDNTQQSAVSEADFLARVSAFERNEEAEARRAREAMRRMISDQTKPPRHDRGGHHGPKRRDRSPSGGPAVAGIFREYPYRFQGPVPTSQPPPQPPVAGFNIYGHHHAAASVYPFFELPTGGPPPLQDPYHDALVLVSAPYHLAAAPFTSHPARLSDPAPVPGKGVPPLRIMSHPSYYPHPDLIRDTDRGREPRGRRSYSPDRHLRNQQQFPPSHAPEASDPTNQYSRRGNAAWPYSSSLVNPHGTCKPATPAPPPHLSSHLAPPPSPTSTKQRPPSFRIDYDLRTHPATLRVSPSSSSVLSQSACTPNEQSMTLICNLFPWIVEIHGSQHTYVTIYDILLQLHTSLHLPLSLDEWTEFPHPQQERIALAWERALAATNPERSWREKLARCFGVGIGVNKSASVSKAGNAYASDAGKARIRLGPNERRYEEGILRIDLLAAQAAASHSDHDGKGPIKPNGSDGMKWVGLVRDDVLARRRGIMDPHDLERCWSLLVE